MELKMASPGELVRKISQAMSIPEATVASTHRYLRDAGLITKGGRGNSAAKMNATDAANLLISLLASQAINDSAEVARAYGSIPLRKFDQVFKLEGLELHKQASTFAAGVGQLIGMLLNGSIAECISEIVGHNLQTNDLDYNNTTLNVAIFRPHMRALIEVNAIVGDGDEVLSKTVLRLEYEITPVVNSAGKTAFPAGFFNGLSHTGLNERRWVELEVVKSVAEII